MGLSYTFIKFYGIVKHHYHISELQHLFARLIVMK